MLYCSFQVLAKRPRTHGGDSSAVREQLLGSTLASLPSGSTAAPAAAVTRALLRFVFTWSISEFKIGTRTIRRNAFAPISPHFGNTGWGTPSVYDVSAMHLPTLVMVG